MRRRHVVLVGLAILLASTMAVGTGADRVSYDEVDTLELQPAGEDNAYVDKNGDGEIRIRVNGEGDSPAGVNDDAITDLGPVFTIENVFTFGEPGADANLATVWVENDGTGAVTFYNVDADDPIETSENGVELPPGESTTVGMRVDTTGETTPTITTLTVRVTVKNLAFETIEYAPDGGETDLDVEQDVTATAVAGEQEIDVTDELTIEDSSESIEVDSESKTIRTVNRGDGWIDVSVGDDSTQIDFDVDWRETDANPMAMEGGGSRASFQQLGVFDRIEFDESVDDPVTVEAFEGMPEGMGDPGGDVIQAVDVTVPESHEDTDATLVFTLEESNVDDPDELVVHHETGGGYETLDTTSETENGIVTVTAETGGFSAFVVTDGSGSDSDSDSSLDADDAADTGFDDAGDDSDAETDDAGDADEGAVSDADDSDPGDGDGDGGASTPDGDGADGGTGGTVSEDDPLFPTELGGLTLSSPLFVLALAAASLLLVFAYRRRDDDGDA